MGEATSIKRTIITDGVQSELIVNGVGIFNAVSGEVKTFVVDPQSLKLARFLVAHADEPYLASHLQKAGINDEPITIAGQHQRIYRSFEHHALRHHFIKVGRGSATWYGFLQDSTNPDRFIERGSSIIEQSEETAARRERRERAFVALREIKEGNTHNRISRKQAFGAAATAVTFGGVVAYVVHSKRHSKP